MAEFRVTYDPSVDAAYIYIVSIGPGEAVEQLSHLERGLVLDFDAAGRLIGIDLLSARQQLPKAVLEQAEQPPA